MDLRSEIEDIIHHWESLDDSVSLSPSEAAGELISVLEALDEDGEQFAEDKPAQSAPQLMAKSRIEDIRERVAALAKRTSDPRLLFDLVMAEIRQTAPLIQADLAAAMYGAALSGFADVIRETPEPAPAPESNIEIRDVGGVGDQRTLQFRRGDQVLGQMFVEYNRAASKVKIVDTVMNVRGGGVMKQIWPKLQEMFAAKGMKRITGVAEPAVAQKVWGPLGFQVTSEPVTASGSHLGIDYTLAGPGARVSLPPPGSTPPPADLVGLLFPDGPPPGVRLPALAKAIDTIQASPLAAGANFRETAELTRQGAFAVTGDLTEQALDDIRQILSRTLETGGTVDDFAAEVRSRLDEGGPLSKNHLETIFRTQTAAAQSSGQDAAIKSPFVADAFPYRAYFATTDARVREDHIALEKLGLNGTNIYRADDPTWKKFRPPWDFNCRCSWSPVSVEQAARRGVTEAKEWWERAKAMAKETGAEPYEMLARTVPFEVEHVTPPQFDPPAEFERR